MRIAIILFLVEINKSLRETEVYLNTMSPVLEKLNLERSPDHTTICRWEQQYDTEKLRDLLRLSAEQIGWTGVGTIDASGLRRDQTSYRYRNRANFSFHSMKTIILIDTETLAIKDGHFTTQKAYAGHIGMEAYRQNADDLQVFLGDKGYSWNELRKECREDGTRSVINHKEHNALKEAHNARIDDYLYPQRWMSETGFSLLKQDDGEKLRSRSWH